MPRTRRQRGGFLDWLFGSTNTAVAANATNATNTEKKNNYNASNGISDDAYTSANTNASSSIVGGRAVSRKGRKSRKSPKSRKASKRKTRMKRRSHRSRRH
jgi:hypothetical protein